MLGPDVSSISNLIVIKQNVFNNTYFSADNCNAYSLHPFSAKDLSIRNLADRLLDLPYLTKLYPNIEKNRAFGKYYTELPSIHNFTVLRMNPNLFLLIISFFFL